MTCGTVTGYKHGCRCFPCCEAKYRYQVEYRRGHIAPLLDADEVLTHIQWLSSRGVGRRSLAMAAGVGTATIQGILEGGRCREATARKILAVGVYDGLPNSRMDAEPTRRHVLSLNGYGWSNQDIGRALGRPSGSFHIKGTVTRRVAERVRVLHNLVHDRRCPPGSLSVDILDRYL